MRTLFLMVTPLPRQEPSDNQRIDHKLRGCAVYFNVPSQYPCLYSRRVLGVVASSQCRRTSTCIQCSTVREKAVQAVLCSVLLRDSWGIQFHLAFPCTLRTQHSMVGSGTGNDGVRVR
jgi:hypothetical protein